MPKRCIAVPATSSTTFLNVMQARDSAVSAPSPSSGMLIDGLMISSCSALAAAISGSSPFSAFFISMPGINRRLISLVPSKMRLTRASR